MKTTKFLRASAVTLAGLLAAYGCAKKETDAPVPHTEKAQSLLNTNALRAKEAWSAFVTRVEGGVALDPLGQYVSKATQVSNGDGTVARLVRPKYDAARPEALPKGGQAGSRYPADEDPYCDGCGGGYYPPAVTSTFVSSESLTLNGDPIDNPTNAIMSVIGLVGSSSSVALGGYLAANYTKLNIDLNKGAGGKYIYLCFSRKSVGTCDGYFDQHRPITRFWNDGDPGIVGGGSSIAAWWATISEPNWGDASVSQRYCRGDVDFNDGAGGPYIYLHYTKLITNQRSFSLPTPSPVQEVGIISGNSSNIQPPAGWVRHGQDLNAGVGGDFVYLCYKY